jgi:hypothetical protein
MYTPAQIIINTILTLIGMGLGYFYFPALVNRIQKKKEWERQRDHGRWTEADIRTDKIAADQKGHRAPADVPPPNKGGDNE